MWLDHISLAYRQKVKILHSLLDFTRCLDPDWLTKVFQGYPDGEFTVHPIFSFRKINRPRSCRQYDGLEEVLAFIQNVRVRAFRTVWRSAMH